MSRRRMTAKRFLELLMQLREEEVIIRSDGIDGTNKSSMGSMLDQAAMYGCSSKIIGYDAGVPIHKRHKKREPSATCMKIRDDSALWRRAGACPKVHDGWMLATLENIWASLTPLQRKVLLLGRQMSVADIVSTLQRDPGVRANGRPVGYRFVIFITEQASRVIEGHSLFKTLQIASPKKSS